MKLIDEKSIKAVRSLASYLEDDERKNYEEMYDIELSDNITVEEMERHDKAHIFNDVVQVLSWLNEPSGQASPRVKITPFDSPRSNKAVANQWVITTDEGEFFQSYRSIIAFKPYGGGKVVLDEGAWDYSTTTGKYRNEFLGEGIADTRAKIASGQYVLANLNQK